MPRRRRSAAQRAAFHRMIAGLRKYKQRRNPWYGIYSSGEGVTALRRFKNPRGVYKRPRRKRHLYAVRAIGAGASLRGRTMLNPRGVYKRPKRPRHYRARGRIPEGAPIKGLVRLNPRRRRKNARRRRRNPGVTTMARRRRRHARRRNPRRRRFHARRRNPRGRRGRFVRRRNPRRRRFHARRRNPGMGGLVAAGKAAIGAALFSVPATFVAGFVDSKWLSSSSILIRTGVKLGLAAVAGIVFRSNAARANAAMGGILGTIGYEFGVRAAGGVVAGASLASKAAGVSALVTEDPRAMGVLVDAMHGMGLQLDTGVSLGAGTALDSGLPANSYTDVNLG
jgi:hypothetical protein